MGLIIYIYIKRLYEAKKETIYEKAVILGKKFLNISYYYYQSLSLRPTLGDTMDCSIPGLPVHHQLPEFTQTPVY